MKVSKKKKKIRSLLTTVPLGPSIKVASARLNVISIITLLVMSEHFSVYVFIKEQASCPQFNRERLQQTVAEMNYGKNRIPVGRV